MSGQGVFSVIDAYLQLASQGEKVVAFRADDCYWRDVWRAENVAAAEQDVASGLLAI
jgi:NDP-sugar pyrophosphorylase family protein